jgi:hypothetical protein
MKKLITAIVTAALMLTVTAIPAGTAGAAGSAPPCMALPPLPPITAPTIKAPAKIGARMDANNTWMMVQFGTVPNYTQYLVTTIAIDPFSPNSGCGTMTSLGTGTVRTTKTDKQGLMQIRMAPGPYVFVIQAKSADGTKVGQRTVIYGEFRNAPTMHWACAVVLGGLYTVADTSKATITFLNGLEGWPKPIKAALAAGQQTLELVELKISDADMQAYLEGKLADKVVSVAVTMVNSKGVTSTMNLRGQISQFVDMMKAAEARGPSIRNDCTW